MVLFKEQSFMSNRSRSENFLAPIDVLQQRFKSSPELGTPRKGINDTSWLNITPAPPRETIDSSEDPIIEEPLRVFLVAAEHLFPFLSLFELTAFSTLSIASVN